MTKSNYQIIPPVLVAIFLFLTLQASGQSSNKPDFGPGVLLDTVTCKADPAQSYAMFLPATWSSEKYFPIIYFFDPMARGKLPLEKYKDIANSHEIIMVCSNNSRNGSWDLAFEAANAVFADTWKRLNLDTNQVFAGGFSGGARVATSIALKTGKIKGLVGAGAGFPVMSEYKTEAGKSIPFAGIVGRTDMNWLEMHDTERQLSTMGIPNRLIPFDGPHEWPDPELIAQALDFLFVETLGNESHLLGKEWATARQQHRWQVAQAFEGIGEPYLAFYQWKNVRDDFGWLNENGAASDAGPDFRDALKQEAKILETERKQRAELMKHFLFNLDNYRDTSELNWWELEGKALAHMRNSKNVGEAAMAERITRTIAARAIESPVPLTDYPKTISLYKIWTLVEPQAIWPHYRLAVAYAGAKENKLALATLKQAIKNGLNKKERLEEPTEFDHLRKKKKFKKLLAKLAP